MTITIDQHLCLPVVCVSGSITETNFVRLDATINEFSAEGHQMIGLDLSGVKLIGESQARALVAARQRLSRCRQKLALVGLSPPVIESLSQASS